MNFYTGRDPVSSRPEWLLRFGAIAGVLFGLSLGIPGIVEAFTGETAVTSFIVGLGVAAFGLPALYAFYLRQAQVAGRFGAVAFAINAIGLGLWSGGSFAFNLVLFFVDDSVYNAVLAGPTMWAILVTGPIYVVGLILFGASMVLSGVLPRVAAVGYSVGLVTIALLGLVGDSLISSLAHVVAAASLITLSVRVWQTTNPLSAGSALTEPKSTAAAKEVTR